jgi:hypothetical protein
VAGGFAVMVNWSSKAWSGLVLMRGAMKAP